MASSGPAYAKSGSSPGSQRPHFTIQPVCLRVIGSLLTRRMFANVFAATGDLRLLPANIWLERKSRAKIPCDMIMNGLRWLAAENNHQTSHTHTHTRGILNRGIRVLPVMCVCVRVWKKRGECK